MRELASEGGLTPLHLAAYSGSENVVRGLLNSPAVQVSLTSRISHTESPLTALVILHCISQTTVRK